MLETTDPRTGHRTATGLSETTLEELEQITGSAVAAGVALQGFDRTWRAGLLRALADELEAQRRALVDAGVNETGLTEQRLDGEVTRSANQFRMFADVIDEGSFLEVAIDHAADSPAGRLPDIRRMLVPIGPVAVFGSSNFPFAFSVAGGDTASALAAGNPVIVKAHGSHLLVSQLSFEALSAAARAYGAPDGTIQIVYGQKPGADLVAHPAVRAVGFTGSQSTAEILLAIINDRPAPIPFYGELSSLNPLIVTPGAAQTRGGEIAAGLLQSILGSGGQLCTKPGIVFVPSAETTLRDELLRGVEGSSSAVLLNERIADSYEEITARIVEAGAVTTAEGGHSETGCSVAPRLLTVNAKDFDPAVAEEAFGPLAVLVAYDSPEEITDALAAIPDSLTATIHSESDEQELRTRLVGAVHEHVGRIVFNGYPTGVRVSWAQHHGGPWPATNSLHTSVGATAIRRFLRPLAWQDAPADVLPADLRDDASIPQRIDGVLTINV